MSKRTLLSITDQVVELIREGIYSAKWKNTLPGRDRLAKEFGVSHLTIEAAMRRLAKDGLLISQGSGRRRMIVLPEGKTLPKNFRIAYLAYESMSLSPPQVLDLLERLRIEGFSVEISQKSLIDLNMDVNRIARLVQQTQADAWIIASATREVLEWFCNQPVPVYAYFGNKSELPIAGCSIKRDIHAFIRRLTDLGHRRIVLLIREEHIKPNLSFFSRLFLDALEDAGIVPSTYNLPAWGYQPEGLHRCLDELFKLTPPTALITSETSIMIATRDHLTKRGLSSPHDVSLISLDQSPLYAWCSPFISHFVWDVTSINRRVVRWAKRVATGEDDKLQIFTSAKFIEGETIGPAPKKEEWSPQSPQ